MCAPCLPPAAPSAARRSEFGAVPARRGWASSQRWTVSQKPTRWTVFELPSTLGSFLYVRSSMCGPDRAGGGQDWVVVIICQAAAAARELDAAAHRRHGGGQTPRSAAPLERRGSSPRDRRRRMQGTSSPLPWKTALAARALWFVGTPARTSSSPSPASAGFLETASRRGACCCSGSMRRKDSCAGTDQSARFMRECPGQ